MTEQVYNIVRIAIAIIVGVFIPIVAKVILPAYKKRLEIAEAQAADSQTQAKLKWAKAGVEAAQQLMGADTGDGKLNIQKKEYAVGFLKNALAVLNITITDEQADGLVEAAVFAKNNPSVNI